MPMPVRNFSRCSMVDSELRRRCAARWALPVPLPQRHSGSLQDIRGTNVRMPPLRMRRVTCNAGLVHAVSSTRAAIMMTPTEGGIRRDLDGHSRRRAALRSRYPVASLRPAPRLCAYGMVKGLQLQLAGDFPPACICLLRRRAHPLSTLSIQRTIESADAPRADSRTRLCLPHIHTYRHGARWRRGRALTPMHKRHLPSDRSPTAHEETEGLRPTADTTRC